MSSYNKINGTHASDDKRLLSDILRGEWGFDGVVMTDWGGLSDRIEAFKAGCDLNMPGGSSYMEIAAYNAVMKGELSESDVNRSAERIATLAEKCSRTESCEVDSEAHHAIAKEIAVKGAVLLKNEGELLPLTDGEFDIIGNMAKDMRYQGSGSSHINPTKLTSIADAARGIPIVEAGDKFGSVSEQELMAAREAARAHKAAIVVVGLPDSYESESFDREHMRLPDGYIRLVRAVAEANPNTAVVLLGGAAVELPFINEARSILYMGLPGQAGGEAVMDLITGKATPSGKLTESWPVSYDDVISSDTFGKKNTEYREGVYVGYRYYDKAQIGVAYPFGHGLSYTEFKYEDLEINGKTVGFTVKNTGTRRGEEISQIYIHPIDDKLLRPQRSLGGFVKTALEAGEEKRVEITLDDYPFRYWDGEWKIPSGRYLIEVGSSSRDIRLSAEISVDGVEISPPKHLFGSWYDTLKGKPDREEWQRLMGKEIPEAREPRKGEFTMDSTCLEMKDSSLVMRLQYKITENVIAKSFGGKKDLSDPAYKMMLTNATDGPMRTVVISSNGMMSESMARAFLEMANGRYLRGIKELIFPQKRIKKPKK
jgi:beta-glucosidase